MCCKFENATLAKGGIFNAALHLFLNKEECNNGLGSHLKDDVYDDIPYLVGKSIVFATQNYFTNVLNIFASCTWNDII